MSMRENHAAWIWDSKLDDGIDLAKSYLSYWIPLPRAVTLHKTKCQLDLKNAMHRMAIIMQQSG